MVIDEYSESPFIMKFMIFTSWILSVPHGLLKLTYSKSTQSMKPYRLLCTPFYQTPVDILMISTEAAQHTGLNPTKVY
jgi:hypothetical protein